VFHSIRWRIAIPYTVLTLLIMMALTLFVTERARSAHLADLKAQSLAEARLVADHARRLLADGQSAEALDEATRRWAEAIDARVTLVDPQGQVVGESQADRSRMDNHLSRPEVQEALASGVGASQRRSDTVDQMMLYTAVPIQDGGQTVGIARVGLSLSRIDAQVAGLRRPLIAASLAAAGLVFLLALLVAGRTTRPVVRLTEVADAIASGDFSTRLAPTTRDEVGQLTSAFNKMADELDDKMSRLTEERSRLATVLENMADGVIITDTGGAVRLINTAATRLLNTTPSNALGRSFAQVVRHYQIIDLWQQCRAQNESQVAPIEIDRQGIFWQVIITSFHETGARGYLVIIQDLSRIRRLETVRRDFISNISHELRTPLASLKALTETLRDGALDDPPAAERFLDSMETEIDALTQMVQELLELSRIESGQVALRLRPTPVEDIILPPVERLLPQAERSEVELLTELPSDLPSVLADVERTQQVVTNLVHNAIKFTPQEGRIFVRAWSSQAEKLPLEARQGSGGPMVVVEVTDTGAGIPARDLPRVFERFYKADRARGRGGTGLGLSIARHLVESHGGRIWVTSQEGSGSSFFFTLPAADEE
jgi:two-component system phosphate regulon sensor histidine kinase PhoR